MKAWGKITTILLAATLAGCALAPGMKMSEPAEIDDGVVIRVQPLTLDLLNRLDAAREQQVREVAEEFAVRQQGYVIGSGDVLQIIVWDHPALTTPAGQVRDAETSGQQVGEDGYVYYPYVGMINGAGLNIPAI